jgi:hypothetical protein
MLDDDNDFAEFDRKTPVQRFAVPAVGVFLVIGAGALGYTLIRGSHTPAARPHVEPHITQVQLPPPPPPPPPPKVQPPEPKKEVETTRPRETVPTKQATQAPKAPAPPNRVETSVAGNGPSSLGAGNGGGGDCIGTGCGNGDGPGGGGDNDAYYANIVKTQIQAALRQDDKLRFARYRMTVSLVLDAGGHVAQASIGSFDGDPDIEAEVTRVLRRISTGDTPPAAVVAKQFSVHITERAPG